MSPERMRERAKEAREMAQAMRDPHDKARLHEIANILERVADDLEARGDPERRT